MRALTFFVLISIFCVHAFDELTTISRDELIAARTISLGTFEPAEEFDGIQQQDAYIQQFKDILEKGLKSSGYQIVSVQDSGSQPDLLISGKFLVMENGDAKKRVNIGYGAGKSGCKVYFKAVIPQSGKVVLGRTDRKSSLKGDHVDELATNVAEVGHDIVEFFIELKRENRIAPAKAFTCSEIENKKIAYCMLYVEQKRVTANILHAELQKLFMRKKVPIERIDFKIETTFRNIYTNEFEGSMINQLPEEVLNDLKSKNIDYLMLMYNVSDQRPSARVRKVIRVNGVSQDLMGEANRYSNIFCNLGLFNISLNAPVLVADLWADSEQCGDNVVGCMVRMIYKSVSEMNGKKIVPCLRRQK